MTHSSFIVSWSSAGRLGVADHEMSDSGHGGRTPDRDGDEVNGFDEGQNNLY